MIKLETKSGLYPITLISDNIFYKFKLQIFWRVNQIFLKKFLCEFGSLFFALLVFFFILNIIEKKVQFLSANVFKFLMSYVNKLLIFCQWVNLFQYN